MGAEQKSQFRRRPGEGVIASTGPPIVRELVVPNPRLKLLDQVREVMRLRHYSISVKARREQGLRDGQNLVSWQQPILN